MAIAKGGMSGVSAGGEGDSLPSPRSNRYYSITLPLKNIYGTIEISDKAIRASADSSGAFVNLLNAEMEGLIADAKANFARMLYGDGSGYIANVKRKISKNVIEVDAIKTFYAGMAIEIENSSGNIETTITRIDKAACTITVSGNLTDVTLSGGEKIWIKGVIDKEILGLATLFDDEWLYGFKKTSEPFFRPYMLEVPSASLCEEDLVKVIDELEEEADQKVNMILCSYKTKRKIAKLLEGSRQIINTTDIEAGCTSIYINEVPVYADKFCPEGRIYFVNTNDFVLNQLCDWTWLEDESGKVLRQVVGKAAYTATLVKYAELICKKPCGQGMIKITD